MSRCQEVKNLKNLTFESEIESKLVRGIEDLGGVALKYEAGEGWPDRICVLPDGKILWVETKRPDGRVAVLQKWRHKFLRKLGHRVEVPKTKEEVERLISSL